MEGRKGRDKAMARDEKSVMQAMITSAWGCVCLLLLVKKRGEKADGTPVSLPLCSSVYVCLFGRCQKRHTYPPAQTWRPMLKASRAMTQAAFSGGRIKISPLHFTLVAVYQKGCIKGQS